MPRREWDKLNPQTTYTLTASNGWEFTLVDAHTVTLAHKNAHAAASMAATQLTVDPDPGSGNQIPPTKP